MRLHNEVPPASEEDDSARAVASGLSRERGAYHSHALTDRRARLASAEYEMLQRMISSLLERLGGEPRDFVEGESREERSEGAKGVRLQSRDNKLQVVFHRRAGVLRAVVLKGKRAEAWEVPGGRREVLGGRMGQQGCQKVPFEGNCYIEQRFRDLSALQVQTDESESFQRLERLRPQPFDCDATHILEVQTLKRGKRETSSPGIMSKSIS